MYFKTKLILFCFLNINLTPVYGDELQFGHVFPECDDVCARFQMSSKPIFSFSIWNVTCQDLFCLVKTRWYSSVIIPSSDPDEFVVDYDISILKLRRRSLDIIPNMEIWMGLLWTDENLRLCDCSGQERQELSMKFWYGDIWLPDVHIYPSYFINRRTFLHQFNNFYLLKQNRTRNGVGVNFKRDTLRRREPIMASCKELLTGFYETFKNRKVGKMDNVQLNIMYKKRRKKNSKL